MGSGMSHNGMSQDVRTRAENEKAGEPLCSRCEGTGNEIYSMYRKCCACNGTGVSKQPLSHKSVPET